jgi:hypothetical protein
MIESVESKAKPFSDKASWLDLNEEGKYRLRILPLKDGSNKYPVYRVFVHGGFVDPNRGKTSVFKCAGSGCPLCAVAKAEKAAGDESAWKRAARAFFLYNVIDASGNFRVLKATGKLHDSIESEWLAKAKGERVNIFDIKDGCAIEITRRGQGSKTEWPVKVALEASPASPSEIESLEKSRPLHELYMSFTKEQLEMVVSGTPWKPGPPPLGPIVPRASLSPASLPKPIAAPGPEAEEPAPRFDLFPEDPVPPEPVAEKSEDEVTAMKNKIFGKKKSK